MTTITFDTLKFVEIMDEVATRRDIKELELRIAADMAKINGELATLRWGMAITVGGIVALILKSFFPH